MQIINKRKVQGWVKFDRSLMRDTRIKSPQKILYLLFCSLSETLDNIYPSYTWLAQEVGYKYTGDHEIGSEQFERAMKKFISENLQPLIDLGWIEKTNKDGTSSDYIVYDHDCQEIENDTDNREQKSTHTVNKKVHGNREQKSTLSKKSIFRYIEEDILLDSQVKEKLKDWTNMRIKMKKEPTEEAVNIAVKLLNKFSTETQIQMIEQSILNGYTGLFEIKSNKQQTPPKPNDNPENIARIPTQAELMNS